MVGWLAVEHKIDTDEAEAPERNVALRSFGPYVGGDPDALARLAGMRVG
jgi:hypothetical protein